MRRGMGGRVLSSFFVWSLLFRTSGASLRADFSRCKRLVTSELVFYVGGITPIHLFGA